MPETLSQHMLGGTNENYQKASVTLDNALAKIQNKAQ
jgi:hypothetical protein